MEKLKHKILDKQDVPKACFKCAKKYNRLKENDGKYTCPYGDDCYLNLHVFREK